MRRFLTLFGILTLFFILPNNMTAQVGVTVVLQEGDMVGGGTVTDLNIPFTNGNGQVGFLGTTQIGGTDVRFIWYDNAAIFLDTDALPDVLSGGETSSMGIGNNMEFIYSPSFNGEDAVFTHNGLLAVENTQAPGFPAGINSTFHSRPRMAPDGTAYWLSGFNDGMGGTSSQGRIFYTATPTGVISILLTEGTMIGGQAINNAGAIDFDYDFSDNNLHTINIVNFLTGAFNDDTAVIVDGNNEAQESNPNGSGDNWDNFDIVSINNNGDYVFSGDTDGATSTDEFIAVNGIITIREGDVIDGTTLNTSAFVRALTMNNNGEVLHVWSTSGEEILFRGNVLDLAATSVEILRTGDLIDVDGDGIGDFTLTDFNTFPNTGNLGDDTVIFINADWEDASGQEFSGILQIGMAAMGDCMIACPTDVSRVLGSGECSAVVNYDIELIGDCIGTNLVRTSGLASGESFPIGTTVVSHTLEDVDGMTIGSCSFNVEVAGVPAEDQPSGLACTGQANIPLDTNCEGLVSPDLLLVGGPYGCEDDYPVELFYDMALTMPVPSSPSVTSSEAGLTIFAQVSGPNGSPCWSAVLVEDKTDPTIECMNVVVECTDNTEPSASGPVFFPIASDACGTPDLDWTDVVAEGGCVDGFQRIITRTWTATDASGRTAVCTQTITVNLADPTNVIPPLDFDDIAEPALLCELKDATGTPGCWNTIKAGDFEDDLYVGHPSPDAANGCSGTGRPGGATACGTIGASFEDIRLNICPSGDSEGCYKIIRRWTMVDWCTSNVTEHDQIIKVADKEGPVISDIADLTISVDVWSCDATWYAPAPWLEDNCSEVTGYTISSSAGLVQYSSILDLYVISELPLGTHQVIYTATDCCGNETNLPIFLTVADLVPPVAVCEVFHTTSLTLDGTAKVFAQTFDDGSHDNCNPVYFKTIRMDDLLDTDHGSDGNQSSTECDILNGDDAPAKPGNQIHFDDYAMFCCEDIGEDIMVVFRVFDVDPGDGPIAPNRMKQGGDLYGHFNDCMVEITVEDKLPPYIVCPTDLTISCDYWFDFNNLDEFGKVVDNAADRDSIILYDRATCNGDATVIRKSLGIDGIAADNCNVVISETATDGRTCGTGIITRVFTATDPDGRTASCIQRITVIDCDPFYINDVTCSNSDRDDGVKWPCDYNASACGAETDPSTAGEPQIFNEDNCSLVSVDYDDEVYTIQEDACLKIKRTWVVTDWCNFDEDDSDNNDNYDSTDDGFVEGKWTYIQFIKVLNSRDPEFGTCQDVEICATQDGCVGDISLTQTLTDDCTPLEDLQYDYKIDYNNDGTYDETVYGSLTATGTYPYGTHRILWTAEDRCGNIGSCSYLFTIEDCKEPTPYCDNGLTIPVMPATGEITVWANDFNEGSFDNCTEQANLSWRISRDNIGPGAPLPPASATSVTLDCDDVLNGSVNVNVFVIDEAGNWDYCTTFINVQDQTGVCTDTEARIYGNIENEEALGIEEVDVRLTGGMNSNTMTDLDGSYNFPNLPVGQNYELEPTLNTDHQNGVTTFDLVLISKHILNIERFTSPYKLIAADVNNSGTITTLDMVNLRRLILFMDTELQYNTSWRFVDASFVFPFPENPFLSAFPEIVSINSLQEDLEQEFIGIKIGDVNCSALPNSMAQARERSSGDFVIKTKEQELAKGEEFTVDFKAEDLTTLLGYQFTIDFEETAVEFVKTEGLSDDNFGFAMLDKGVITTSWNSQEEVTFAKDEIIFSMTFRALSNQNLSEVIKVSSAFTKAEAYDSNLSILDLSLEFENSNVNTAFDLYQNQPNPFKDATMIGFVLPSASSAVLTVYDVSGKVLSRVEGDFGKGYNQIHLSKSDLGGTGILYYTLETAMNSATKKMIFLE